MIAVDTNVLVYAHRLESPLQLPAQTALANALREHGALGVPVFCIGEFLRVVTSRRYPSGPSAPTDAARFIANIVERDDVSILAPGECYFSRLQNLVTRLTLAGNAIFDAQIAAVCLEHGVRDILTNDRDFDRFEGLRRIAL